MAVGDAIMATSEMLRPRGRRQNHGPRDLPLSVQSKKKLIKDDRLNKTASLSPYVLI